MIEVPGEPVAGTGPTSEVPITISGESPGGSLVVSLSRPAAGGEEPIGRWTFENPGVGEKRR